MACLDEIGVLQDSVARIRDERVRLWDMLEACNVVNRQLRFQIEIYRPIQPSEFAVEWRLVIQARVTGELEAGRPILHLRFFKEFGK